MFPDEWVRECMCEYVHALLYVHVALTLCIMFMCAFVHLLNIYVCDLTPCIPIILNYRSLPPESIPAKPKEPVSDGEDDYSVGQRMVQQVVKGGDEKRRSTYEGRAIAVPEPVPRRVSMPESPHKPVAPAVQTVDNEKEESR